MAEIRDKADVDAEIVAGCQAAVAAALSTAAGQQQQASAVFPPAVNETVANARPPKQGPSTPTLTPGTLPTIPIDYLVTPGPADPVG